MTLQVYRQTAAKHVCQVSMICVCGSVGALILAVSCIKHQKLQKGQFFYSTKISKSDRVIENVLNCFFFCYFFSRTWIAADNFFHSKLSLSSPTLAD